MFDQVIKELNLSNETLSEIGELCQELIPFYTAEQIEVFILSAIEETLKELN